MKPLTLPLPADALIVGLESTCDETSCAVVAGGRRVVSNVVATQIDLHQRFGGVVPEIASRAHLEAVNTVMAEAFERAGLDPSQVAGVAVANRPGLIGSLLVGLMAAKTLAWAWDVPLVGANHIHAHGYSPALDDEPIEYPAVAMVASGGHTSLYHARSAIELELLGSTTDDAAGEAFDKVAAILGLPYPGGPNVDKAARTGDPKAIKFPRALLKGQSLDFSFSGLKTAVLYHVQGVPGGRREKVQRGVAQPPSAVGEGASGAGRGLAPGAIKDRMAGAPELTSAQIADIAASFQAALVDTLRIKIRRAVTATGAKSLIIGGGVAANSALRAMVQELGEKLRLQVRMPPMKYCGDNAAMIAGLAWHLFNSGQQDSLEVECTATVRK